MYPTPSRWWEIIEKHKVSIFHIAPTAIRSLEALGDKVKPPN
jgi:acetyl-CoA synthetase